MAEAPKSQMPARRKARKRALDVLFEADLRDLPVEEVLRAYVQRLEQPRPEHLGYAISLVEGVNAHLDRIDELIASYAEGWTLDRMPVVDRNLARIAVYELLYVDEIDDAVAITEAVELAQRHLTDFPRDEAWLRQAVATCGKAGAVTSQRDAARLLAEFDPAMTAKADQLDGRIRETSPSWRPTVPGEPEQVTPASPAKVLHVEVNAAEKVTRVFVPDYQLSLAIGKRGQNACLAAKLTGWKIDIKSETQAEQEGIAYPKAGDEGADLE